MGWTNVVGTTSTSENPGTAESTGMFYLGSLQRKPKAKEMTALSENLKARGARHEPFTWDFSHSMILLDLAIVIGISF